MPTVSTVWLSCSKCFPCAVMSLCVAVLSERSLSLSISLPRDLHVLPCTCLPACSTNSSNHGNPCAERARTSMHLSARVVARFAESMLSKIRFPWRKFPQRHFLFWSSGVSKIPPRSCGIQAESEYIQYHLMRLHPGPSTKCRFSIFQCSNLCNCRHFHFPSAGTSHV